MEYNPHEYQTYTTDFILSHPVAAILLQMGLGKSVITLTAMKTLFERREIHRALVIAPLRVARDTWPEEIEKWDHLKSLTYSVAIGKAAKRKEALRRDVQIHIINRENLCWMLASGIPLTYDMIVVDELSSFKNWKTKRFQALLKMRPTVGRIVGLTGTPTGNGLMDLFAEYRVLDLGERLGRFIGQYREKYFLPDRRNAQRIFTWKPRPGAEEAIYRKIGDITVSMKSADYLEMPERVYSTMHVYMDAEEKKKYETLKEKLFLQLSEDQVVDAKNAATLCGKLTQMASGACYTEDGSVARIHDRKLDALEDLIEAAGDHPLLIVYYFRHELERIRERFPQVRILETSQDHKDWKAGRIGLAVVHPESDAFGLNLQQGGNTLIWFGLTWSLELYQQMNSRLWRQGQTADTVVIYHIVMKDSIDEQILTALERKDSTQESLINAVRANLG